MLALMPLAERLSFLTEQLTLHSNETVGGGLNSTLGNALETVFSIVALVKAKLSLDAGEMTKQFFLALIQTSLLGSMLSYLLLVQGTVFLVGY
jgi:Ca2+:H+ antiporter